MLLPPPWLKPYFSTLDHGLYKITEAQAWQPSERPTKPNFSPVVALTETQSSPIPMVSDKTERICDIYLAILGFCKAMVISALPIFQPLSEARETTLLKR